MRFLWGVRICRPSSCPSADTPRTPSRPGIRTAVVFTPEDKVPVRIAEGTTAAPNPTRSGCEGPGAGIRQQKRCHEHSAAGRAGAQKKRRAGRPSARLLLVSRAARPGVFSHRVERHGPAERQAARCSRMADMAGTPGPALRTAPDPGKRAQPGLSVRSTQDASYSLIMRHEPYRWHLLLHSLRSVCGNLRRGTQSCVRRRRCGRPGSRSLGCA